MFSLEEMFLPLKHTGTLTDHDKQSFGLSVLKMCPRGLLHMELGSLSVNRQGLATNSSLHLISVPFEMVLVLTDPRDRHTKHLALGRPISHQYPC